MSVGNLLPLEIITGDQINYLPKIHLILVDVIKLTISTIVVITSSYEIHPQTEGLIINNCSNHVVYHHMTLF